MGVLIFVREAKQLNDCSKILTVPLCDLTILLTRPSTSSSMVFHFPVRLWAERDTVIAVKTAVRTMRIMGPN